MKLKVFFLLTVFALALGCNKENNLTINEDDVTTSLKEVELITFEGTTIPMFIFPIDVPPYVTHIIDPGTTNVLPNGKIQMMGQVSLWCESSEVDLVAGRSIWTVNSLTQTDGSVKFWGKADIFVGGDCSDLEGPYEGKWQLSWHGYGTPTTDPLGISIEVSANGQGKEGNVKGMVGKWTYTMNFDFANPATFFYTSEGFIK